MRLPTGAFITPTAAAGADFRPLNPDLPTRPDFVAGQAVSTAVSPDGNTLLVLTSGYNRNNGPDGRGARFTALVLVAALAAQRFVETPAQRWLERRLAAAGRQPPSLDRRPTLTPSLRAR